MQPSCPPDIRRAELRQMLTELLPTDGDFDAFCLDYAPSTAEHFSSGMGRISKINIVLQLLEPALLLQLLRDAKPGEVRRWLIAHRGLYESRELLATDAVVNQSIPSCGAQIGFAKSPSRRYLIWVPVSVAISFGCIAVGHGWYPKSIPDRRSFKKLQPELKYVDKPGGAFAIHETEVTVSQYQSCVDAGRCNPANSTAYWNDISDAEQQLYSPFCNAGKLEKSNHPINCINWHDASEYCSWLGMRLPSGEEWEYAATGGDGRLYPWGDAPPTASRLNACDETCVAFAAGLGMRWRREGQCRVQLVPQEGKPSDQLLYGSDGFSMTAPVGSYPAGASAFGLLDMAGNVREWTRDSEEIWWNGKRRKTYILRGGGYLEVEEHDIRSTNRTARAPADVRVGMHGFRCLRMQNDLNHSLIDYSIAGATHGATYADPK